MVSFGIEVNTKPLDEANKKTDDFSSKLGKIAGGLAAAFALDKVRDFVFGMVGAADAVGDQAARLNLSTKALEEWSYAAKFADIEAGELNGVFDKLARSSVEAGDATSEQGKKLKQLGVNVKDANGNFKDTGSLFEEVGLALAGVDDQTKRTALSFDFFGKTAGPKVLQLFKDGPEGIKKFRAEFEELGGGFGDFVEAAGEVDDQMHRLNTAWEITKGKIAHALAPAVKWLTEAMTDGLAAFNKLAKESNIVQAALGVLGAVAVALGAKVLIAWGPAILATTLWAAAIAFVVLAVEDLITFFQGGDSLIGRAIESWFGPGSAEKVRQWGKDLAEGVGPFLKGTLKGALDLVLSVLGLVGMALTDDTKKVNDLGDAFLKNSASIVDAVDKVLGKLREVAGFTGPTLDEIAADDHVGRADTTGESLWRKVATTVLGDPLKDPKNVAANDAIAAEHARRKSVRNLLLPPATISGPPAGFLNWAPPAGGGAVTINNNIQVDASNATPATAHRVGQEVRRGLERPNAAAAGSFVKHGRNK